MGAAPGAPSPMRRYVARQLAQLVVAIIGISLLAFAILHVLGDPVLLLLPQNAGRAEFERYRHLLGLDQPLYVQYWKFASRAVLGDFGKSWYADTPAFRLVLERMPPTIYLPILQNPAPFPVVGTYELRFGGSMAVVPSYSAGYHWLVPPPMKP